MWLVGVVNSATNVQLEPPLRSSDASSAHCSLFQRDAPCSHVCQQIPAPPRACNQLTPNEVQGEESEAKGEESEEMPVLAMTVPWPVYKFLH